MQIQPRKLIQDIERDLIPVQGASTRGSHVGTTYNHPLSTPFIPNELTGLPPTPTTPLLFLFFHLPFLFYTSYASSSSRYADTRHWSWAIGQAGRWLVCTPDRRLLCIDWVSHNQPRHVDILVGITESDESTESRLQRDEGVGDW